MARILFVRSTPYDEDLNGYNVQGVGIAKALCRLGYDCDYLNFHKTKDETIDVFSSENIGLGASVLPTDGMIGVGHLEDSEGNIVEEWISTNEAHVVKGLKTNEEYTLKETVAPDGYIITSEITFVIDEDGNVVTRGTTTTDEDGNTVILVEDDIDSIPEFDKKIKDTNDSTGETSDWQDSADYDIGDDVPYRLRAILAENVTSYLKYFIKFNDILEDSLTFKEVTKVTVNGEEVNDYELTSADHNFELTLTWGDGVTKIVDETLNKALVEVFFTAVLNENAVLGSHGNLNTAYLEFSNNPKNIDSKDR